MTLSRVPRADHSRRLPVAPTGTVTSEGDRAAGRPGARFPIEPQAHGPGLRPLRPPTRSGKPADSGRGRGRIPSTGAGNQPCATCAHTHRGGVAPGLGRSLGMAQPSSPPLAGRCPCSCARIRRSLVQKAPILTKYRTRRPAGHTLCPSLLIARVTATSGSHGHGAMLPGHSPRVCATCTSG